MMASNHEIDLMPLQYDLPQWLYSPQPNNTIQYFLNLMDFGFKTIFILKYYAEFYSTM